jgi:hypothetical protein
VTDFVEASTEACLESPCAGDASEVDDPLAGATDVRVIDGPLNLRAEPGTDAEILETLATGTSLPTVTGSDLVSVDGYIWIEVSRLSGTPREGWLATAFLAEGDGSSGGATGDLSLFEGAIGGFVIDGPLNLRENPDTGADVLLLLETGDYVWIDAIADDGEAWVADGYTWIRVMVAGEIGYLAIDFLSPE